VVCRQERRSERELVTGDGERNGKFHADGDYDRKHVGWDGDGDVHGIK
jgi:hypothetical protein